MTLTKLSISEKLAKLDEEEEVAWSWLATGHSKSEALGIIRSCCEIRAILHQTNR